nr:MAG TPA: hypothetical protein [Caudoviricetes sp.]
MSDRTAQDSMENSEENAKKEWILTSRPGAPGRDVRTHTYLIGRRSRRKEKDARARSVLDF